MHQELRRALEYHYGIEVQEFSIPQPPTSNITYLLGNSYFAKLTRKDIVPEAVYAARRQALHNLSQMGGVLVPHIIKTKEGATYTQVGPFFLEIHEQFPNVCLLYTSPSPRD